MDTQDKAEKGKRFILDSFRARSPVFITTLSDEWISGYLNEEPNDIFFVVLDMRQKKSIRILYSAIRQYKEFRGDFAQLPLPSYIEKPHTDADKNASSSGVASDDSHDMGGNNK